MEPSTPWGIELENRPVDGYGDRFYINSVSASGTNNLFIENKDGQASGMSQLNVGGGAGGGGEAIEDFCN